jgi:hypothetical protein
MRHLLTIRFDRELRERVQREVERNRSNIDTEIMALVDAALEHLTRRLPTSDLDPQEANRSMRRTTSREGLGTRCAPYSTNLYGFGTRSSRPPQPRSGPDLRVGAVRVAPESRLPSPVATPTPPDGQ